MQDQKQRKRKSRWGDHEPESAEKNDEQEELERPGFGFVSKPFDANKSIETPVPEKSPESDFMRQIREATERAKKIASTVTKSTNNSISSLSPPKRVKTDHATATMTEEQKKQYAEQKEV
jgi:hypothetical protein